MKGPRSRFIPLEIIPRHSVAWVSVWDNVCLVPHPSGISNGIYLRQKQFLHWIVNDSCLYKFSTGNGVAIVSIKTLSVSLYV